MPPGRCICQRSTCSGATAEGYNDPADDNHLHFNHSGHNREDIDNVYFTVHNDDVRQTDVTAANHNRHDHQCPTPAEHTQVVTTNSQGEDVTITITNTNSATDTSASASSTASSGSSSSDNSDSGLGTGSIVGIAVAGGVAVLGVIAFVIWKFTRKRFNDFDDSEAIQWPELNAHGGAAPDTHPFPHTTPVELDSARIRKSPSPAHPPKPAPITLPQILVPTMIHTPQPLPYHDDPNAVGAYYDPYRGPIPNTFEQGAGGEVYPMTQMGRASPAPGAALAYPDVGGRASPGPQAAYGGRSSPGPQAAYGMGMGRTASPGPQMAYGRSSPGPQAAYGGAR
ncbi:hypothetical protein BDZ89DRAFT_1041972 [Hymenopellis radicata]|nr:hypothetical protein BDZ89DRAFT_1041972 [Hymenopellis radicata]